MVPTRIAHVVIHGQVQGVGFRAWVQRRAELEGIEGWVRNRRDGTVEAVFSGPPEKVEAMLAACRSGPALARVDRVEPADGDAALLGSAGSGRFETLATV
jgi:acylphosphatase